MGDSNATGSFISVKCWPLSHQQRGKKKKKTVKIGPSGVLKHDNGKEGRLFIVLPL